MKISRNPFFITSLIIGLLAGILYNSCAYGRTFPKAVNIRVAVLKDAKTFTLSVKGRYRLFDLSTQKTLDKARSLRKSKVISTENGIRIKNEEYLTDRMRIIPRKDASIYINKRCFRGVVDIRKDEKGFLLVVNTVDCEKYVKGVLYHEVSHRWPLEALKAQAVAARTYALYHKLVNQDKTYDLTNDIYSQVYGGRTSEKYRTNIAVNRTQGLIMKYNDKILPAYYHATCAGRTEDVKNLWNVDLPPLKGVVCPFCKRSPHYRWKRNFQLRKIQEKLNKNGYQLGLIKEIAIVKRNESGRIETLKITTRNNQKITIAGKDFRNIVGPNLIRSNKYKPVMRGYYVDLVGNGWGHGVGLCQWGANFMARKRYRFDQILEYYYPGVTITQYEVAGF